MKNKRGAMFRNNNKELKKKMMIRNTINAMNKQIQKLEELKSNYIESGREAKERGLTAQYNLALSGLRMCIAQQKRIYEMKLNFEITSQMKDVAKITGEFLKGMTSLSKDMIKLTKEADFKNVAKQFEQAMTGVEMSQVQMENFLDETSASFDTACYNSVDDKNEIEKLMAGGTSGSNDDLDTAIDRELEELKKRMI